MSMDWVVGWWTEPAGAQQFNLNWISAPLGLQLNLQLVSDGDLQVHGDDVIVERVIGQYWFYADGAEDVFWNHVHMRLCVRPEDPSVGTVWNAPINSFGMADEKFMWHKVHALQVTDGSTQPGTQVGTSNFFGQQAHPEWSHLDVRVNRRLQELERLCLIFEWDAPAAGMTGILHVAAWIRVLVKGR